MGSFLGGLLSRKFNSAPELAASREALAALKAGNTLPSSARIEQSTACAHVPPALHADLDLSVIVEQIAAHVGCPVLEPTIEPQCGLVAAGPSVAHGFMGGVGLSPIDSGPGMSASDDAAAPVAANLLADPLVAASTEEVGALIDDDQACIQVTVEDQPPVVGAEAVQPPEVQEVAKPKAKRKRAAKGLASPWKLPTGTGVASDPDGPMRKVIPTSFEASGFSLRLDAEGQPLG